MAKANQSNGGAGAALYVPEDHSDLDALRESAAICRGCELYKNATQTVFGRGEVGARLMLVGEQPGDQEDREGEPFVGPAGKLLSSVLDEVGLSREELYVTNAVKHFKWKPSGKRRLHVKPASREISACRPWLVAEVDAVHPPMLVCLGATAAKAVLGPSFRITQQRGEVFHTELAPWTMATYHPSALLRVPDATKRDRMRAMFTEDLRVAAEYLRTL